jgi:hypothetical protein
MLRLTTCHNLKPKKEESILHAKHENASICLQTSSEIQNVIAGESMDLVDMAQDMLMSTNSLHILTYSLRCISGILSTPFLS